ncbi:hypothetical protein BH24DEI2_BH24DEI2_07780 [soil metagenome]
MKQARLYLVALLLLVACGSSGTDAPTAVVATPGPGLVTVSWQDNSSDEEGFVVYRKTALSEAELGAQVFEKLAQTPPDVTKYEDKKVEPQRFYRYQVTALRQGRESAAAVSPNAVQPKPPQAVLTVNLTGTGTVTSAPPGVTCSAKTCTGAFDEGTRVKLTAAPGTNSGFVAWGGACSSTVCEVVMDAAQTVEARFERTQFVLKVTRAGAASGKVVSTPAGIDCGKDCDEIYKKGLDVSFQATPAEGAVFGGWGGDCSGNGLCFLKFTADKKITAEFTFPPPVVEGFSADPPSILLGQRSTLTWAASGKGSVKLSISPNVGDVTGKTSTTVRPSGSTTYTLKATSEFGSAEKTVRVEVRPSATLTLKVTGGGTVEGVVPVNVIDCSSASGDCAETFDLNESVTLQATNGNVVTWVGCDQLQGNTCTLKMTGDKAVTANF